MTKRKGRMFAVFLLTLAMIGCREATVQDTSDRASQYGSFTPEDALSYDGKYLARQSVEKVAEQNIRYIRIDIIEQESETIVDSFYPARAMDFWGICWEKDNYNLWTQSSDIGNYCYRYTGGQWERDDNAIMPEYIITRLQMKEMVAASEMSVSESEPTSNESVISAELPSDTQSWQEAYVDLLQESLGKDFFLCDMDSDYIPELLVGGSSIETGKHANYNLYIYKNYQIECLGEVSTLSWSGLWLDNNGGILGYSYGTGGGGTIPLLYQ